MLALSWKMPDQWSKLSQRLTSLEASYTMSLVLNRIIFWPLLNRECIIITRNRNHFSFISLILKPLWKFLSEIQICCHKNSPLFKPRIKSFSSVVRKRKTISDSSSPTILMSWMSKHTALKRRHLWSHLDLGTNLLTFIENLNTKQRIIFMLLARSIQMRHPKNVKSTTSLRTSGQKSATWSNQDITILQPFLMEDTSMLSVEETQWTKHHWKVLRD